VLINHQSALFKNEVIMASIIMLEFKKYSRINIFKEIDEQLKNQFEIVFQYPYKFYISTIQIPPATVRKSADNLKKTKNYQQYIKSMHFSASLTKK
jgi:hypothetical protein